jgi:hypothetical protein
MSHFRGSALLAGLVAISSVLALGGTAAAAPTVSPTVSAVAKPAAVSAPAAKTAAARSGRPPSNYAMKPGNYFSYPNRTPVWQVNIRNRVLAMVNSTWGYYTTTSTDPVTNKTTTTWHRGRIRMTTWSFDDTGMRTALVRAAQRGVQVQVIGAQQVNQKLHRKEWNSLRKALNSPWARSKGNVVRQCRGSCRGSGGTPHSKFFLFDDVASGHYRNVVVQTSMNLTKFAQTGQWNQATTMWNKTVFDQFMTIFNESARNRNLGNSAYRRYTIPGVVSSIFYPGGGLRRDPVLQALSQVQCTGAGSGGVNGRTRIRVIQYAIYETRGNAIAKRLRQLWNAGCNVGVIYSVTSRPVLAILRSHSGRGPVPMRQSVIKNGAGDVVKYNHSKWVAISGNYGGSPSTWTVVNGSSNWSNFAYGCDEQMQQIYGAGWVSPYFSTWDYTWRQKSSRPPMAGGNASGAREAAALRAIPEQPTFGRGIYKYMTAGG